MSDPELYQKQLELYDLLGLKECAMDLEQLFLGLANEIRGLAKDIKESESVMQNWCNVVQVAGSLSRDSHSLGTSLSRTENEEIADQSSAILLVPQRNQ